VIWSYKPLAFKVEIDGKRHDGRYHMITIGNGICEGGGFYVTPDADPCDGVFDVCLIEGVTRWQVFKILPVILMRRHEKLREVRFVRARRISIECEEDFVAHADGEIVAHNLRKIGCDLVAKALNVAC
jgi:diacylglycerol kinase family enzyme